MATVWVRGGLIAWIKGAPEGEPIYSGQATRITATDDDESGWEFLWVEQSGRTDAGKIAIDPDEWPAIRDAIDSMIKQCGCAK